MLKINRVNHFLLLKYTRKKLNSPTEFSDEQKQLYLNCQDVLFHRTIEQLQFFHPNAHIHVLTNEDMKSSSEVTYYVHNETWDNLLCKFKLYSLIQEPAMFVDLDIVFNKAIYPIECNAPFCFFNTSWGAPLQAYSSKKLPINQNVIYNSGITWINAPNKSITNELMELHDKYFSDDQYILSKGLWPNNDEHALSLFVGIHNYEMPLDEKINMSRNKLEKLKIEISQKSIKRYQSIHFNGVLTKKKMIDEYHLFEMAQHHTNKDVKRFFNLGPML